MANRWDVKPTGEIMMDKILEWLETDKADIICWTVIVIAILVFVAQIVRYWVSM